ncbi:hypothetical protein B0E33_01290 [Roseibium algicola]|uniref:Uncharacterized protein n=1 Tax=Roseibium algicola TaxID=2857014 RepID=A0ABM6HWI2_9HYPH|nr:hypothetical protein [Roseibium aggregatum]AQQ02389.1 hypothetical protein B0E33_01290 [Roseibium aggregatum]
MRYSARFTNLPGRLRNGSELISLGGNIEIGEALAISGTMRDAALKIEALERELENAQSKTNRDS